MYMLGFLRGQKLLAGEFGGAFKRGQRGVGPDALQIRLSVRGPRYSPGFRRRFRFLGSRRLPCGMNGCEQRDHGKSRNRSDPGEESQAVHACIVPHGPLGVREKTTGISGRVESSDRLR